MGITYRLKCSPINNHFEQLGHLFFNLVKKILGRWATSLFSQFTSVVSVTTDEDMTELNQSDMFYESDQIHRLAHALTFNHNGLGDNGKLRTMLVCNKSTRYMSMLAICQAVLLQEFDEPS